MEAVGNDSISFQPISTSLVHDTNKPKYKHTSRPLVALLLFFARSSTILRHLFRLHPHILRLLNHLLCVIIVNLLTLSLSHSCHHRHLSSCLDIRYILDTVLLTSSLFTNGVELVSDNGDGLGTLNSCWHWYFSVGEELFACFAQCLRDVTNVDCPGKFEEGGDCFFQLLGCHSSLFFIEIGRFCVIICFVARTTTSSSFGFDCFRLLLFHCPLCSFYFLHCLPSRSSSIHTSTKQLEVICHCLLSLLHTSSMSSDSKSGVLESKELFSLYLKCKSNSHQEGSSKRRISNLFSFLLNRNLERCPIILVLCLKVWHNFLSQVQCTLDLTLTLL
mmetsp:Transcript_17263/g.37446  ORF Transcript_17263/g.37446 Transcript_17263/m.37446 type:complete len:332 (-) Transcript_17263:513-1508(-)